MMVEGVPPSWRVAHHDARTWAAVIQLYFGAAIEKVATILDADDKHAATLLIPEGPTTW